jgi:hypothetical protein
MLTALTWLTQTPMAIGIGVWAVQRWDFYLAHPPVSEMPALSLPAVLVVLAAVLPVWAAPPPATSNAATTTEPQEVAAR